MGKVVLRRRRSYGAIRPTSLVSNIQRSSRSRYTRQARGDANSNLCRRRWRALGSHRAMYEGVILRLLVKGHEPFLERIDWPCCSDLGLMSSMRHSALSKTFGVITSALVCSCLNRFHAPAFALSLLVSPREMLTMSVRSVTRSAGALLRTQQPAVRRAGTRNYASAATAASSLSADFKSTIDVSIRIL